MPCPKTWFSLSWFNLQCEWGIRVYEKDKKIKGRKKSNLKTMVTETMLRSDGKISVVHEYRTDTFLRTLRKGQRGRPFLQ